ncbi:MAG: hypothetical protein QXH21_09020 [Ignisphaera sp.]
MNRDSTGKTVKVFFLPGIRRIYVYPDKVISTASPNLQRPEHVRYRVSTPEFVVMLVVVTVTSLQLAPYIGLMSTIFLITIAGVILFASNRRKRYLIDKLRERFPEHIVVEVVRKGLSECGRTATPKVVMENGFTVFEVACGRPGKCIEYDRGRVNIFAAVTGFTAVALTATYILRPDLTPFVLAPLVVVLALLSRYSLCKNYSVVPIVRS